MGLTDRNDWRPSVRKAPDETTGVDVTETMALVASAKGSRTIREFAAEMGVAPSTVSRILSGQTKMLSNEILRSIVEHAAPSSGVTMDKMMQAQGRRRGNPAVIKRTLYERICRQIIADDLLLKGYSVKYENLNKQEKLFSSFALYTNALHPSGAKWLFCCAESGVSFSRYFSLLNIDMWLNHVMSYFYQGGEARRVSFVTNSVTLARKVAFLLSPVRIPNEISVICISSKHNQVEKELISRGLLGEAEGKIILGASPDEKSEILPYQY